MKLKTPIGLHSPLLAVLASIAAGALVCTALQPLAAMAQGNVVDNSDSILNRLLREYRRRPVLRDFAPGDKLGEYAEQCRQATGITLPSKFSCGDGVEVPGQGTQPRGGACDHPNVLNSVCDPGSRFQVLAGRSADAVAVAHCRKDGQAATGSLYNDIAIIQYNKTNGAVCFFQALDNGMPGTDIPSPAVGDTAKWADQKVHWLSPAATHGIGCTACHDNGGFVRSNYIAQLRTPPNAMPNEADGYSNAVSPLRYVGVEFANDRSWSIVTANHPNDNGPSCASCHRLAVNNVNVHPGAHGTALDFALRATGATQTSKNPHSPTSPIWMRPGQVFFNEGAFETAKRFHACAAGFKASNFTSAPPGCTVQPLGTVWIPPAIKTPEGMVPIIEYYLSHSATPSDGIAAIIANYLNP